MAGTITTISLLCQVQIAVRCAQVYDVAEFAVLAAKYEALNWRMISKPGGAAVKPDDFYVLYGYFALNPD